MKKIISYVPEIYFKVLLWKLLYGNLTFLHQNWNYFTSVRINTEIYLVNYNYNDWMKKIP